MESGKVVREQLDSAVLDAMGFNEDMNRQSLLGGAIYFTDSLGNTMPVNFRL